ncbi:hypothetical protein, partial [Escherichia coli]|uniref:hypothetical protein n=1 Tax=Escherichia coli TaxID=562 RepID=UPI0019635D69
SLKTSIKTITYLSDIGCLEIQGASLKTSNSAESQKILIHSDYLNNEIAIRINRFNFLVPFSPYTKEIIISK